MNRSEAEDRAHIGVLREEGELPLDDPRVVHVVRVVDGNELTAALLNRSGSLPVSPSV
jgi:hypothetical protein